jgi:hypothetical protein
MIKKEGLAIAVKEGIPSRLRTGVGQIFEWGISKCYNSVGNYGDAAIL